MDTSHSCCSQSSHAVWTQKSHGHNHGLWDCPKYPLGYFPESELHPTNTIPSTYILGQKIMVHSMGSTVSTMALRTLGLGDSLLWGLSWALQDMEEHPWCPPTTASSQKWQLKMSPDMATGTVSAGGGAVWGNWQEVQRGTTPTAFRWLGWAPISHALLCYNHRKSHSA